MAERFPAEFLDDLRARLLVSDVVSQSMALRREGREFRAIDDKSLTVNDEKRLWWDHAKDEGGDIFKWFESRDGLKFPDAVIRCAEIAGVAAPVGGDDGGRVRLRRPAPQLLADGNGRDHHAALDRRGGGDQQPRPPSGGQRTITATYPYTNADGALAYEVVRFEWEENGKRKKNFGQRRPAPGEKGVYIWSLSAGEFMRQGPGKDWTKFDEDQYEKRRCTERRRFDDDVAHGLYRLPELLEEMQTGRAIFLPEGEKDCETLWDWGLPATTNSGGAQNWLAHHAQVFAGADVVIPIDNDGPGRQRGERIAASLKKAGAKRIRILDLARHWADIPDKGDITDWRDQAGGTVEKLIKIVKGLPDWTPAEVRSQFGGVPWERIGVATESYPWVVENIIPAGESVVIYGESGSGKSFNSFDLAMSIARGVNFNGYNVKQGLVVYVAAEAGKGFAKRKVAYCHGHNLDKLFTERLPFYLLTKRPDLFKDDADTKALVEEITAIAATYDVPLRAVFLDTVSALTPGMNENASQDVSKVRERVDRIKDAFGVSVILVHHTPKGGGSPRGHGSFTADFETTIAFSTVEPATSETRPLHRATVVKQREGKSGLSWEFELRVIETGKNEWGNPETSCIVAPVGSRDKVVREEKAAGFALRKAEEPIMRALLLARKRAGVAPSAEMIEAGVPDHVMAVAWADFKAAYQEVSGDFGPDGEAPSADTMRKQFARNHGGLVRGGIIGLARPWMWWTGKPVRGFPETFPKQMPSAAEEEASQIDPLLAGPGDSVDDLF